jgi:hypothetical protein
MAAGRFKSRAAFGSDQVDKAGETGIPQALKERIVLNLPHAENPGHSNSFYCDVVLATSILEELHAALPDAGIAFHGEKRETKVA